MKRIAITDLVKGLGQYLWLVKRRETIEVREDSVPNAGVEALCPGRGHPSDAMERLVRAGFARAPTMRMEKSFWDFTPIPCTGDASTAVIEQRGDR